MFFPLVRISGSTEHLRKPLVYDRLAIAELVVTEEGTSSPLNVRG